MQGPVTRLIRKNGVEYQIRNATGGAGDRTTPSYEPDGTLTAVSERRGMPMVERLSSGEEVQTDLELRAVYDSDQTTIVDEDESDNPTKLDHPSDQTYRVLAKYPEDSGVTVLTVVRD